MHARTWASGSRCGLWAFFLRWLYLPDEFALPYNSWGNGAQAIATCVFLARTSKDVFSEDTKSGQATPLMSLAKGAAHTRSGPTWKGRTSRTPFVWPFPSAAILTQSPCMTGAIAGAKGNIPEAYAKTAYQILNPSLRAVLDEFEKTLSERSLC